MNNRIMAMLLALVAVLFVCGMPMEASASEAGGEVPCTQHVDADGNCVCDTPNCNAEVHNFGTDWKANANTHWHECQNGTCSAHTTPEAHSYTNNCVCVCGDISHSWGNVGRVDSTCTVEGTREHRLCSGCGALSELTSDVIVTEEQLKLPLLSHDTNVSWEHDADRHYKLCGYDCGTEVESVSHSFEYIESGDRHYGQCECGYISEYVPHTNDGSCHCVDCGAELEHQRHYYYSGGMRSCMEDYYEPYFECEICGQLFDRTWTEISEIPVTPARGYHVMNDEWAYPDMREGKHWVHCDSCDYSELREHELVASDPLKGNYHELECHCGLLETEQHYDKNGDNKCDACAHDMGNSKVKVETHDSVTVTTGEKEKADSNKTWWENWQNQLTGSNSGGTASTVVTPNSNTSSAPESGSQSSGNGSQAPESGSQTPETQAPETQTPGVGGSAPVVSTPDATAPSGIMQFISWILGLFGL